MHKDKVEVNTELIAMIKANQTRLAETNSSLNAMVQRQEREAEEREAIWSM